MPLDVPKNLSEPEAQSIAKQLATYLEGSLGGAWVPSVTSTFSCNEYFPGATRLVPPMVISIRAGAAISDTMRWRATVRYSVTTLQFAEGIDPLSAYHGLKHDLEVDVAQRREVLQLLDSPQPGDSKPLGYLERLMLFSDDIGA